MRKWVVGIVFLPMVVSAAVYVTGCFRYDEDCELNPILECGSWTPKGTGAGSSSSSSSSGTGGTPASCIPSDSKKPVADTCGVFVSSDTGDDATGKGTIKAPYKKLSTALGKGMTVYACAGAMPYSEALVLDKAAVMFGGLDCKSWAYVGATRKTKLTADADLIPLTLANAASGAVVHDFAIMAADAKSAGMSSIALLDDQADLTLENVDLVAGKGAAGMAGAPQAKVMTPAGAKGKDGGEDATCVTMGAISGGVGGKNSCDGVDTDGGLGGAGIAANTGGNGGDGQPVSGTNGGSGQPKNGQCTPGQQGLLGMTGGAGTGARSIGDINASGYQAPVGKVGMSGTPGQGGGGGGGARQCDMAGLFAGPSGGGGGAGGCAGLAGKLGQSGGSSIGIVALNAKLTLNAVTISTPNGGIGGLGGDGQQGGDGGQQGNAIGGAACSGGKGGQGGVGGPGAGGAGGHSVGIAMKGGMLPDLGSTTIKHVNGSSGGTGGDMDMSPQTKGDDGLGCTTLDFTSPMSPSACAK